MRAALIARQFDVQGRLVTVEPYGSGNVNDTYLAIFRTTFSEQRFIVQRVRKAIAPRGQARADWQINCDLAARIEKRLEKFALIDQSANGTYITISGRDEIVLRREEFILYGSGTIAFGESPRRQRDVTLVQFQYESPEERLASGK